jgi:uncharacterized protein YjiS (DUF1127 family)
LHRSNLGRWGLVEGTISNRLTRKSRKFRRAVNQKDTAMKMFTRFLRTRRVYWNVLQELSRYTDRELHDIGIDRADIHEIARLASREEA